jgi:predicted PurR-regulated permease PerM
MRLVEKNRWLYALVVLGVLFVGVQLFGIVWDFLRQFSDIILIFVLAWLLAFLLNPAVDFFTVTRQTPRVLAVGAVYLSLLSILVLIGLLIVPPTAIQVSTLGDHFPQYAADVSNFVNNLLAWLGNHGVPVRTQQFGSSEEILKQAQTVGASLASNALTLAQGVAVVLFDGVIILVVSFYIMMDGPRITGAIIRVTPESYRDDAGLILASVDRSFGGFLRASLVLMFVYGVGTAIAMFILGVPFALPVGVFAGVMMIIPLVGAIVAVIPPVIIALATVSLAKAALLLAIMVALQQLVLQVLQPRIMGKSVGLHPLWVLASVLVGARVAGVWGALFSVPVAAILQTVVQLYYFRAAGNADRESEITQSILAGHATAAEAAGANLDWQEEVPPAAPKSDTPEVPTI